MNESTTVLEIRRQRRRLRTVASGVLGAILGALWVWPGIARHGGALYILAGALVGGAIGVAWSRRAARNAAVPETGDAALRWRPQFTLRSILVTTFVVAAWLSLCSVVPHVAVLVLGMILAAVTTFVLVRLRRKARGLRLRHRDRLAFASLWMFTLLAWAFFYVASIGPAVAVAERYRLDSRWFVAFYGPVMWLHEATPLRKPLEDYADAWGWH